MDAMVGRYLGKFLVDKRHRWNRYLHILAYNSQFKRFNVDRIYLDGESASIQTGTYVFIDEPSRISILEERYAECSRDEWVQALERARELLKDI